VNAVTLVGFPDGPERRPATEQWRPVASSPPSGCGHGRSAGRLDERARRLSHEELAVAHHLAAEGHHAASLREHPGNGPVADLEVCGQAVEVKSWLPLPQRDGRVPGPRSVVNKLLSARDQAATVVLYARGSGLTETAARAGMAEYAGRRDGGKVRTVRILGDGFDLGWERTRVAERSASADGPRLLGPEQALGR